MVARIFFPSGGGIATAAWAIGPVARANPVEKVLLVGSLFMVLVVELLNSAIEAVIERYGPEYHELAGRAKDMGSAAVFITLGNVVLCWVLILGPRLF